MPSEDTPPETPGSLTDVVEAAARADRQRVGRAIRGAIRAGHDGVDINRKDPLDGVGIVSIEPWNRPAPDGANGYQTERYSWDWFSDDELTQLLADGPDKMLVEAIDE